MTEPQFDARDILRKAFPGIPPVEADKMVSIAETQSYEPGVVLCVEGAFEDVFYIILEGRVRVTKVINDDEDRLLKILVPGDFFGEMGLIHNAPRAATVTTVDPTTVLSIYKKEFESMLQISSSVSLAMVKEVSRRLRENDEMAIEDLRLKAGELAAAYHRLAQEDFARREFLTTIAHELRTPLTAASGYLHMVRHNGVEESTRQEALGTVARNLQHIISLVNDILFLQEVELVMPEMHAQDVGEILSAALERLEPEASKRKIHLDVDIAPGLPLVNGHFNSLEKAVTKVLDNAIKFSPGGEVVQIAVAGDDREVRIKVADHGVGIPEHVLPHIFERFYRMEEVNDELFGGLGLGLAITKQVIEQHGGCIEVESKVGEGSTFTIILDAAVNPLPDYKI
jgi:signal transduction histidine kinase